MGTSSEPIAIYHRFDMVKNVTEYTAALPVERAPDSLPQELVAGELNAPKTFKIKHTGAYRHLGSAWSAGMMMERSKTFRRDKSTDPFEVYVTDPAAMQEADLVTEVHWPAQ